MAYQTLAIRGTGYSEEAHASPECYDEETFMFRDTLLTAGAGVAVNLLVPYSHMVVLNGTRALKQRNFMRFATGTAVGGIRIYTWDAPKNDVFPMGQLIADVSMTFAGPVCDAKHPITQVADAGNKWWPCSLAAVNSSYSVDGVKVSQVGTGQEVFLILDGLACYGMAIEPYAMTGASAIICAGKRIQL